MKLKELLTKLFNEAKQRIRLKLLGLFILLVIAATFVIGIIEGSISDAFVALFILFLMFATVALGDMCWRSYKKRRDIPIRDRREIYGTKKLADRQIKWLIRIFPISGLVGPMGIAINILVYAGIIWSILMELGVV